MSNITSKTNIDGELIDFVCAEDIYINNRLVIKKNINGLIHLDFQMEKLYSLMVLVELQKTSF